jgi:hypothetical protein
MYGTKMKRTRDVSYCSSSIAGKSMKNATKPSNSRGSESLLSREILGSILIRDDFMPFLMMLRLLFFRQITISTKLTADSELA